MKRSKYFNYLVLSFMVALIWFIPLNASAKETVFKFHDTSQSDDTDIYQTDKGVVFKIADSEEEYQYCSSNSLFYGIQTLEQSLKKKKYVVGIEGRYFYYTNVKDPYDSSSYLYEPNSDNFEGSAKKAMKKAKVSKSKSFDLVLADFIHNNYGSFNDFKKSFNKSRLYIYNSDDTPYAEISFKDLANYISFPEYTPVKSSNSSMKVVAKVTSDRTDNADVKITYKNVSPKGNKLSSVMIQHKSDSSYSYFHSFTDTENSLKSATIEMNNPKKGTYNVIATDIHKNTYKTTIKISASKDADDDSVDTTEKGTAESDKSSAKPLKVNIVDIPTKIKDNATSVDITLVANKASIISVSDTNAAFKSVSDDNKSYVFTISSNGVYNYTATAQNASKETITGKFEVKCFSDSQPKAKQMKWSGSRTNARLTNEELLGLSKNEDGEYIIDQAGIEFDKFFSIIVILAVSGIVLILIGSGKINLKKIFRKFLSLVLIITMFATSFNIVSVFDSDISSMNKVEAAEGGTSGGSSSAGTGSHSGVGSGWIITNLGWRLKVFLFDGTDGYDKLVQCLDNTGIFTLTNPSSKKSSSETDINIYMTAQGANKVNEGGNITKTYYVGEKLPGGTISSYITQSGLSSGSNYVDSEGHFKLNAPTGDCKSYITGFVFDTDVLNNSFADIGNKNFAKKVDSVFDGALSGAGLIDENGKFTCGVILTAEAVVQINGMDYTWGMCEGDFYNVKAGFGDYSRRDIDSKINSAFKSVSFPGKEVSGDGSVSDYTNVGTITKENDDGTKVKVNINTAKEANENTRGWGQYGVSPFGNDETATPTSDNTVKGVVLNVLTYTGTLGDTSSGNMSYSGSVDFPYLSIKGKNLSHVSLSKELSPKLQSLKNKAVKSQSKSEMVDLNTKAKAQGAISGKDGEDIDDYTIVYSDISQYAISAADKKVSSLYTGVSKLKENADKFKIDTKQTNVPVSTTNDLALGQYYTVMNLSYGSDSQDNSKPLANAFNSLTGVSGSIAEWNDKGASDKATQTYASNLFAEAYNAYANANTYTNKGDTDKSEDITYGDNGNASKMSLDKSSSKWGMADIVQIKGDDVTSQYVTISYDASDAESDSKIKPEASSPASVEYMSTEYEDITAPANTTYVVYEKKTDDKDITNTSLYKDLTKEQTYNDITNKIKDKGQSFKEGNNVVVGTGTYKNNKNYGYNIYFITINASANLHATLDLQDYELNHVYSNLIYKIDNYNITSRDQLMLNTNPGVSYASDEHDMDWDVPSCDTSHSSLDHQASSHKLDKIELYEESESTNDGKTVKQDDSFINSNKTVLLPQFYGDGSKKWYTRTQLKDIVTREITADGTLKSNKNIHVDTAYDLSRGTSKDIRNISGIAYSSTSDISRSYHDGNKDDPSFATATLKQTGIDVIPNKDTIENVNKDMNTRDSDALVPGNYTEKINYKARWKYTQSTTNRILKVKENLSHKEDPVYDVDSNGETYIDYYTHEHTSGKHSIKNGGRLNAFVFTANGVSSLVDKITINVKENYHKYITEKIPAGEPEETKYLKDYNTTPNNVVSGSYDDTFEKYDNRLHYGLVYNQKYDGDVSDADVKLNYYPEVTMSEQTYKDDTLTGSSSVTLTGVETMGEIERNTVSGGFYFMKLLGGDKGSEEYGLSGSLFSDTYSLSNSSTKNNNDQTVYSGSDITLNVDTDKLGLEFYGYGMDVIDKDSDDTMKLSDVKSMTYTDIVKSGADVYQTWGNSNTGDDIKKDFYEYVKNWDKVGNFGADLMLNLGNNNKYNNFSASIGKLQSIEGLDDIVSDGVYPLTFDHGKLVENDVYKALMKQIAEDYYGYDKNNSESYINNAKKIFKASKLHKAILDSIESETSDINNSQNVSSTDTDLDDAEHWYDESVRTIVIRRYHTKNRLLFKNVILSDKADYNVKTSNGVAKWYLTIYVNNKNMARLSDSLSYYNPQKPSTKKSALESGTILMNNVYVSGADFNVSGDSTDFMGN